MNPASEVVRAARQLAVKAARVEKESRLRLASNSDYWKRLNPGLRISERLKYPIEESELSPARQRSLLESLHEHGYFQGDAILSRELVARVRGCVEALRGERWPAVFAFVYDELWAIARGASLVRLLSAVLGRRYTQKPNIWAHYVQPGSCEIGRAHV